MEDEVEWGLRGWESESGQIRAGRGRKGGEDKEDHDKLECTHFKALS